MWEIKIVCRRKNEQLSIHAESIWAAPVMYVQRTKIEGFAQWACSHGKEVIHDQ
jgi:hypothetical protein